MPSALKEGRLFVAKAPLYKAIKYNKDGSRDMKLYYSEDEIQKERNKLNNYTINRFKGLGEMNIDEVSDAITNYETRRLVQIQVPSQRDLDEMIELTMGGSTEESKQWLSDNIMYEDGEEE